MAKKTEKSNSRIRKSSGKKPKSRSKFAMICRLFFVAGLWCAILGVIAIAWFASELPKITADVKFERKRAITFLAEDGSIFSQIGELKGESVNVRELPPHVLHALLSVEDRRFYSHFGIDPLGIARAMVANVTKGRFAQGGSTITQQLAKNLFLTQERTLKRKIQEAILAVWLENRLTKDEILTAYFNRVYFGAGTYGIQAAAEKYFQKDARNLDVYQGAMLVGLLKAPSRYSPLSNPDLAKKRTDVVFAAMKDAGYHYEGNGAGTMKLVETTVKNARQELYFVDWLMDEVNLHVGAIQDDLIVHTTFSPVLQGKAEKALADKLAEVSDQKVSQGAVLVLENDGAVRAMVGGKDYGQSQFNRATQALRPPGSSFKPFVYLTALNRGWRPNDRIYDGPITEGSYRPGNFGDIYYGEVTLAQGLEKSMNTVAVRLAGQIGTIGYVIGTAKKLGITADLARDMSLSLGSSGVSLLEMVSAYSVFPNMGFRPEPYAILKIQDKDDNVYYSFDPASLSHQRLFPQSVIADMNGMLEAVVSQGTARAAYPGFQAGGKTGTSQDFRDAWFIGYTGKYTAGVWLGNDDNSPTDRMTGGKAPAEIWGAIMHGTEEKRIESTLSEWNSQPNNPIDQRREEDKNDSNEGGGFTGFLSRIISNAPEPSQEKPQYNE